MLQNSIRDRRGVTFKLDSGDERHTNHGLQLWLGGILDIKASARVVWDGIERGLVMD